MAAFGHAWVLMETVGVGQTELDVMKLADTTVVVLVPESGDAVQTMKAGLMEAADIFVVNKADRSGAPGLMAELKIRRASALREPDVAPRTWTGRSRAGRRGPEQRSGMAELLAEIRRHRASPGGQRRPEARRRARRRAELQALLVEALTASGTATGRRRRPRADPRAGGRAAPTPIRGADDPRPSPTA